MKKNSELVYTTDPGRQPCPKCGKLECRCTPETSLPRKQQSIRVSLDKKGRRGKTVTLAEGFSVNPTHLSEIARDIKRHIGAGGTAKQRRIEIQGDHRKKVAALLEEMGFKVKFVGG